ncbi:MAG: DUF2786 domain-containing protein, partial [Acidimicrobiia bacterium]|nr:DUF2786 domain-containing protein [Acidimicrobiia bacterium]
ERLVAFAVAVDHRDREPATLHPTWRQHLGALALPAVRRHQGWLRSGELAGSFTTVPDWSDLVDLASAVLFQLSVLRRLQEIVPPPGSSAVDVEHSIVDLAAEGSSPMLAKVRHLLAQAESTTFDAEAEAFTAKAQELMARHAIDAAMVWDRNEREGSPTTIRIPIDDPYWNAKGLLLAVVAEESRCRAVLDSGYAMASLVGFESDLVWCETLFTSLLVQAQHELGRAGAADHAGGRRRSRSFRSSFLVAYAHRIGDRLAEVNAHVQQATVDADSDGELSSLLPVLASRRAAIDDAVDAQFGQLSTMPIRGGSDPLGWNAGWAAAERARLTRGDLESREAS